MQVENKWTYIKQIIWFFTISAIYVHSINIGHYNLIQIRPLAQNNWLHKIKRIKPALFYQMTQKNHDATLPMSPNTIWAQNVKSLDVYNAKQSC